MHKHLVQLKRNNGKSSQYTGKDDENKNDKLLASVKCEASKNRPYNIKFFTSRKGQITKKADKTTCWQNGGRQTAQVLKRVRIR